MSSPPGGGLNECLRLMKKESGVLSPTQGPPTQSPMSDNLSRPASTNQQMPPITSGPFQPIPSQTPKVSISFQQRIIINRLHNLITPIFYRCFLG